jgi:hypothetical protein
LRHWTTIMRRQAGADLLLLLLLWGVVVAPALLKWTVRRASFWAGDTFHFDRNNNTTNARAEQSAWIATTCIRDQARCSRLEISLTTMPGLLRNTHPRRLTRTRDDEQQRVREICPERSPSRRHFHYKTVIKTTPRKRRLWLGLGLTIVSRSLRDKNPRLLTRIRDDEEHLQRARCESCPN